MDLSAIFLIPGWKISQNFVMSGPKMIITMKAAILDKFERRLAMFRLINANIAGILWLFLALGATLHAKAQTAPVLVSVTPANGATQVPASTSLVFVFDQDMDDSVPLFPSGPGFAGTFDISSPGLNFQVTGTWSDDQRTLTVTSEADNNEFANGAYSWTLNPPGSFVVLRIKSLAGIDLATTSGTFTVGAASTGPTLLSSVPANGATGVAVDSQVEFKFSQAMKTNVPAAVSWTGTGIDASKFTYTWSADARSLFCKYTGNLPANTQITWLLNPSAAPVKLESQAGQTLPVDIYSGQFKTGSSCNAGGLPDGWGTYNLSKTSNFEQTSPADPVPQTDESAFTFGAFVNGSQSGGALTAGSVSLPNGTQTNLTVFGNFGSLIETPTSEAALNTAFPAGNYTLRFTQTSQPERVISMTMTATAPPVPKIVNFTETQAVNAAADFTLRWNGIPGAGTDDQLSIFITDTTGNVLFQAPDPCFPRVLPVTATSVVIPANTLPPNQTFSATLLFGHSFYRSTNAVPEMAGFGSIVRETHFDIKTGTGGGTVLPATLSSFSLLANGNPKFKLTGTVAHGYTLQRTGNLRTPNWQQVGTVTTDALGSALFEDTQVGKVFPLFYRAVAN